MATIRVHKTKDYTVMSNTHFREKNMSLKAKGLLSLMLSLPDDWNYSIAGLVAMCVEEESAIVSALKELKKLGYLRVDKLMPNETESGRIEYVYNVFENPSNGQSVENQGIEKQSIEKQGIEKQSIEKQGIEKQSIEKQGIENQGLEFQGLEFQGLEFQGLENPPLLNTNIPNTKQSNTNNIKERKTDSKADSFDAILDKYIEENIPLNDRKTIRDLLGEWLKVRKAKRAAMTNRAITLNLNRLKGFASESRMSIAQYIEEVIIRGWQAFFVIRDWNSACSAGRKSSGATSGELSHHYTSEQLQSYFSDLHDFDNLCDRWDL